MAMGKAIRQWVGIGLSGGIAELTGPEYWRIAPDHKHRCANWPAGSPIRIEDQSDKLWSKRLIGPDGAWVAALPCHGLDRRWPEPLT